MMFLMQNPWQAVHDEFRDGGSTSETLSALLVISSLLGLLAVVHRIQQRKTEPAEINDPRKLFISVLRRLNVSVIHRDVLLRMARDLKLQHPTAVLLDPQSFQTRAMDWVTHHPTSRNQDERQLNAISVALFEQPLRPQGNLKADPS